MLARRRRVYSKSHYRRSKKRSFLQSCCGLRSRLRQKEICPMEFRSQAGKAWLPVLICQREVTLT